MNGNGPTLKSNISEVLHKLKGSGFKTKGKRRRMKIGWTDKGHLIDDMGESIGMTSSPAWAAQDTRSWSH